MLDYIGFNECKLIASFVLVIFMCPLVELNP